MLSPKAVIWYAINPTFTSKHIKRVKDIWPPGRTHQPVAVIDVEGHTLLEMAQDAFVKMQGENWSPRGEANFLISALGLKHTSMSVGDIVVIWTGSDAMPAEFSVALVVDPIGFRILDDRG